MTIFNEQNRIERQIFKELKRKIKNAEKIYGIETHLYHEVYNIDGWTLDFFRNAGRYMLFIEDKNGKEVFNATCNMPGCALIEYDLLGDKGLRVFNGVLRVARKRYAKECHRNVAKDEAKQAIEEMKQTERKKRVALQNLAKVRQL